MIRILKIVTIVLCCVITFVCSSTMLIDTLRAHTYTNNPLPAISSYSIKTNVTNRFAETMVTSVVRNVKGYPRKTIFSVVIPENAFVTKFTMEINNRVYESFVVGIDEGQNYINIHNTGAHVSVRNSNEFDLAVNLEPFSTTVFKLHYEELLERKNGKYEIIANIFPRQLVENLEVEVIIKEDEKIAYFNSPYLKTGDIILKNQTDYKADVFANITSHTGYIKFTPGMVNQFKLACDGLRGVNSFAAQFVVAYDVTRSSPSQVLADGEFFVTYFSPPNLKPLEQFIIFVLDVSGSMDVENRLKHLKEAMHLILDTVSDKDVFNIITYSYESTSMLIDNSVKKEAYPATKSNIQNSKNLIDQLIADGGTNIYDALKTTLDLIETIQKNTANSYTSKIVFLTDGDPTVGITDPNLIISEISQQNIDLKAPIYTISLGESANRTLLINLASNNNGFETHIYDQTDKQEQLKDFYERIKSPVLKNIQFKNLNDITDMTTSNVPLLFDGSEIIAAGKGGMWKITRNTPFVTTGQTNNGTIEYKPSVKVPSAKLDRLWAYLYVKQLLKNSLISKNPEELRKKARDVAITYSLVTDVTMLIARGLPNGNRSINLVRDYTPRESIEQNRLCRRISWPAATRGPLIYTTTAVTTTAVTTSAPTAKHTSTSIYTTAPSYPSWSTNRYDFSTLYSSTTKNYPFYTYTTRSPYWNNQNVTTESIPTTTNNPKKSFTPDACLLNSDQGPCRAYTTKFTFDKRYGVCRPFRYGGCLGNENKFDSLEECSKNCVTMEDYDKCSLPAMRGPCSANLSKWFFDQNDNECKEFSYGGCRGNSNKFESKTDCERDCIKSEKRDICQFVPDLNDTNCGISKINYYYNVDKCVPFKYTGCDKTRKGFESLDKCKISCEKSSVNCGYSFDPGHCNNFTRQWYFDVKFGSCVMFSYSGCGGNGNRFATEDECNQVCRFVETIDKCNLPKSPGTCREVSKRWYHDYEKQECFEFDYHCYGNTNNFNSEDECYSNCAVRRN
ncbi:unnamed protein product [Brassicogethes aeneus]|uniref:Inter-alpha-trypsin inhibitor heavy chain H3-like n=1 Tax=Brassicogethes aeneus TaxID=1431903 RepID=A0A9P0B335_BRAAE|nr:unnamed protein product [Brassicogethes aeneus]